MCAKVQLKRVKFKQRCLYTLGFNQNPEPTTTHRRIYLLKRAHRSFFKRFLNRNLLIPAGLHVQIQAFRINLNEGLQRAILHKSRLRTYA